MTFKEFDFAVSTSFVCPLVYGDVSGLNADDIAALDAFLARIGKNCGNGGYWDFSEDTNFGRCEVCRLGAETVRATYMVPVAD